MLKSEQIELMQKVLEIIIDDTFWFFIKSSKNKIRKKKNLILCCDCYITNHKTNAIIPRIKPPKA